MPMCELLTMLYELRYDVEKQITYHGYQDDYTKRLDKMIQIVKPYADQENNNEKHSEELFDELSNWFRNLYINVYNNNWHNICCAILRIEGKHTPLWVDGQVLLSMPCISNYNMPSYIYYIL